MTDKEKILAEIERLKKEIPYHENAWSVLDKLKGFINSLPAEQPSEELEEEIKRKYESNNALMMPIEDFRKLIHHFTNWQKEQILKSAIEVKINRDTLYNLKSIIHEKYQDLKIGDKILIVKEDEQCSTE